MSARNEEQVKAWRHTRKGLITGVEGEDTGTFVVIRLVGDHPHLGEDGETITVRRAFLTEVKDD